MLTANCSLYSISKFFSHKVVFRYINKNIQHEEYTIDFGHPNIIEMSVPFETESVKEKEVDVNRIMRKLNMTYKQKQAINLIMDTKYPNT